MRTETHLCQCDPCVGRHAALSMRVCIWEKADLRWQVHVCFISHSKSSRASFSFASALNETCSLTWNCKLKGALVEELKLEGQAGLLGLQ